MNPSSHVVSFLKKSGVFVAVASLALLLFSSCNDMGTSPYSPVIAYKNRSISAIKAVVIPPDTAVSTGGFIDRYTVSPALPAGLSLNTSTGVISGTPSISTNVSVNYIVTASGPSGMGRDTLTLCIGDGADSCNVGKGPVRPIITYGQRGISAVKNTLIPLDTVISTGGAINSYSITPALPTGLTLNPKTGVISGTPTTVQSATLYAVTATGPSGVNSVNIGICVANIGGTCIANVDPPQLEYILPYLWGTTDTVFADTPLSSSGTITGYSINPTLPAGMTFNTTTGIISGKPTVANGPWDYTVIATGPFGADTVFMAIRIYSNSFPIALLNKGRERYNSCNSCHGVSGQGDGGSTPPHYKSDFLMKDKHRGIRLEILGLPNASDTATTISVAGRSYSEQMPAMNASDSEIAGVLTFIRGTLNGDTGYVRVEDVAQVRDSLLARCVQLGTACEFQAHWP